MLYADKDLALDSFAYEDLAKPEWKGKVCIRSGQHPYTTSLIAAMIAHDGEAATEEWLRGVKANLARAAAGGDREVARDILGSICDIGIANAYYVGRMKNEPEGGEQRQWGDAIVVDGLSLALQRGQIGCLLGASGCGKTTMLRAIAGFEPLHAGRIVLDGQIVAGPEGHWPPERRRVGMMFQDYALFPHLSVGANVAFGLRGMAREARDVRVREMLERVGLGALARMIDSTLAMVKRFRV